MTADALEVQIAHLEGAFEQVDKRLGSIENRMSALERKVDEGFARVRVEMDRQFFWVLGLLVVSILLPVGLRLAGH